MKQYTIRLLNNDKEIYTEIMLYPSLHGVRNRGRFILQNIGRILKGQFSIKISYETNSGKYSKEIKINE